MTRHNCILLCFVLLLGFVTLAPSPALADDKAAENEKASGEKIDGDKIDVGGLELVIPKTWKKEKPTTQLRTAQFRLGDANDEKKSAELAIFKFGASSIAQNVQRWIGQYQEDGRTVKVTRGTSPQGQYLVVELSGVYKKSIGPPIQGKTVNVAGSRSYNVIFLIPKQGMFFLKLFGPDAFVASQGDALRATFGGDVKGEEKIDL